VKAGCGLATALTLLGLTSSSLALEVETLRDAGPVDRHFNIVVLGDGYTLADQDQLTDDANTLIDAIFRTSPFDHYQALFNVKLLHVLSNETGADNGSYGADRDTALGARFLCDGIDRLLCIDEASVYAFATADVPEFNLALVVVNDPKRGGSGGNVAVTSIESSSVDVVVHELGHTLAHLADEYEDPYPGYPPCSQATDCPEANATLRSTRETLKWNSWVEASTPVVTPSTIGYAAVVGLFEGARYQSMGVYRPWQLCKMRRSDRAFCPVCNEQLIKTFWNLPNIRMVESRVPLAPSLSIDDCDAIDFAVSTPSLALDYTWTVDAKPVGASTSALTLFPVDLGSGPHQVRVVVQDPTPAVRTDPDQLLNEETSWDVEVRVDDCSTSSGGAGGTGASGGAGGTGASASTGGTGTGASAGGGLWGTGGSAGSGGSTITGGAGSSGGTGDTDSTGVGGVGSNASGGTDATGGTGGGSAGNGGAAGDGSMGKGGAAGDGSMGKGGATSTAGASEGGSGGTGGAEDASGGVTSSATDTGTTTTTDAGTMSSAASKEASGGCGCAVIGERPLHPAPIALAGPFALALLGLRRWALARPLQAREDELQNRWFDG
jgi:hypothetical protein